jgi:hypothetical protein
LDGSESRRRFADLPFNEPRQAVAHGRQSLDHRKVEATATQGRTILA